MAKKMKFNQVRTFARTLKVNVEKISGHEYHAWHDDHHDNIATAETLEDLYLEVWALAEQYETLPIERLEKIVREEGEED